MVLKLIFSYHKIDITVFVIFIAVFVISAISILNKILF
jgi:hypothetical protein